MLRKDLSGLIRFQMRVGGTKLFYWFLGQTRWRPRCLPDRCFVSDRILIRGVDSGPSIFRQNGRSFMRQQNPYVSVGSLRDRNMLFPCSLGNRLCRTDGLCCYLRLLWSMLCALNSAGHKWHRWPTQYVLCSWKRFHSDGFPDVFRTSYCRFVHFLV